MHCRLNCSGNTWILSPDIRLQGFASRTETFLPWRCRARSPSSARTEQLARVRVNLT